MKRNLLAAKITAAVFLAAALLCGCNAKDEEPTFTVISDGTQASAQTHEQSAATDDIYNDVSDTELYIPEHMVTKYSSLTFDSRMQEVYDDVVETMVNFETKGLVPLTISTSDYVRVLETVRCEQLMLFYLQSRSSGDYNAAAQTFEMNFTYKYSIHQTNIMLMQTEAAAMEIIAGAEGMSDYEKLKYFHDYLVQNVESSTDDPYADSVYGALVEKKALCEGFAKAYSYLCNIAGIENMIVTGYTDVDHMWNMVKLGGDWYHVDVGWDKPAPALAEMYPDMVLYQYFLAEDDVMENNRIISTLDPPAANSGKYSFFICENAYASSYEEALSVIESAFARCIDAGEKYFMIKLDSSNLYLQTTARLIEPDENGVSDIDRIVEDLNFSGRISYIDYYKGYRIIIFVLE